MTLPVTGPAGTVSFSTLVPAVSSLASKTISRSFQRP